MSIKIDLIKEIPELEKLIEKVNVTSIAAIEYCVYILKKDGAQFKPDSLEQIVFFQEFFISMLVRIGIFLSEHTTHYGDNAELNAKEALAIMYKRAQERFDELEFEDSK